MDSDNNIQIRELSDRLGINEQIVRLLYDRGYTDYDALHDFLSPSITFTPSETLTGMREAVERIRVALANNEKLLIFGDYDCDGICATSILQLYFNSIGADCVHYIPHRADGYGLSVDAIELVIERFMPDLIITVDCGISSVEEVAYCLDLGVDIIVTDHHEPHETLPECVVLNPKLTVGSPLRDLCGASVAMKLVEGLGGRDAADEFLDLACLATIADVVPLVGENRAIAYYGLKKLNGFSRPGLKLLAASCDLKTITAQDVGFRLAPRINAPGRMNYEIDMVELFTSDEPFELTGITEQVNFANAKRQEITKRLFEECNNALSAADLSEKKCIVLCNTSWETGILGLVAAKLCSQYYRPVVLIGAGAEGLRGSARSIPGVNIFEALCACKDLLIGFGGHERAAGLSISADKVKDFALCLDEVIRSRYSKELFVPQKNADIVLNKALCKLSFAKQLELLEPTGEGNPTPVLSVLYSDCKLGRIGTTAHLKGRLNSETDLVAFSRDYLLSAGSAGVDFKLFVEASVKVFNNREYVQLSVTGEEPIDIFSSRDTAAGFAVYLKTALLPAAKDIGIRFSTPENELNLDNIYGTLFVAFSCETAQSFIEKLSKQNSACSMPVLAAGVCNGNPLNTLLVSPCDFSCFAKYSSVVFLDAPLSTGYLAGVSQKAPEPELVLIKEYGFKNTFLSLETSREALTYTAEKLSAFIRSGERVNGINDLFFRLLSFGYKYGNESFTLHFYALYELGWLRVGGSFSLACVDRIPELSASKIINTACKIKEYFSNRR